MKERDPDRVRESEEEEAVLACGGREEEEEVRGASSSAFSACEAGSRKTIRKTNTEIHSNPPTNHAGLVSASMRRLGRMVKSAFARKRLNAGPVTSPNALTPFMCAMKRVRVCGVVTLAMKLLFTAFTPEYIPMRARPATMSHGLPKYCADAYTTFPRIPTSKETTKTSFIVLLSLHHPKIGKNKTCVALQKAMAIPICISVPCNEEVYFQIEGIMTPYSMFAKKPKVITHSKLGKCKFEDLSEVGLIEEAGGGGGGPKGSGLGCLLWYSLGFTGVTRVEEVCLKEEG